MNINEFKKWLVSRLEDGPIKATEIPVELKERCLELDMRQIHMAIRELVLAGFVIEIEYTNPNTSYRSKSMYFHGSADIKISGKIAL